MSDLNEQVLLPHPSKQRILHPMDVRDARSLFIRAWWFARLASVPIAVANGAVVWLASGNLAATLISPAIMVALGATASRWFYARAWEHIPRKRQAPQTPQRWALSATVLDSIALVVAATALTLAVAARPAPPGVVDFAVGAALGVALIQIVEMVADTRHAQSDNARPYRWIPFLAVLVSAAILGTAVEAASGRESTDVLPVILLGIASMLVAQLIWSLADRLSIRRIRALRDARAASSECVRPSNEPE